MGVMKHWRAQPRGVGHVMGRSGWLQDQVILAAAYAGTEQEWATIVTKGWKVVGGGIRAGG